MFDFNIPLFSYILIGVELLLCLVTLIWLLRPLRIVRNRPSLSSYDVPPALETADLSEEIDQASEEGTEGTACESEEIYKDEVSADDSTLPEEEAARDVVGAEEMENPNRESAPCIWSGKASVILYSTVDDDLLDNFLKNIMSQDYPDFEVIVVCDANAETTAILNERYSARYPNVYLTFIPPGSHNLSRRKLALTIGIKAASGEIIVTTEANAVIPSESWLSELLSPFRHDPAIELSLGLSRFDYEDMGAFSRAYREFVTTLTDMRWIGAALRGKAYRGDGVNLAFRRDVFFRYKGYAGNMFLHSGDDDLFVHQIAKPDNTAVVITPQSILTTIWPQATSRVWKLRKSQYEFTSRWLPQGPFFKAGLTSTLQWLIPLCGCAAAIPVLPNLIPAIAAFVIWTLFLILESSAYSHAAASIESKPLFWRVPIFWLYKPIGNAFFRLSQRNSRFKNYTWQRHR